MSEPATRIPSLSQNQFSSPINDIIAQKKEEIDFFGSFGSPGSDNRFNLLSPTAYPDQVNPLSTNSDSLQRISSLMETFQPGKFGAWDSLSSFSCSYLNPSYSSSDSGSSTTSQSSSALPSSLGQSPDPLAVLSSNQGRGTKRKLKEPEIPTNDTAFRGSTKTMEEMQRIKQRIVVLRGQIDKLQKEEGQEINAYNAYVKLLNDNKAKTGYNFSFPGLITPEQDLIQKVHTAIQQYKATIVTQPTPEDVFIDTVFKAIHKYEKPTA